MKNLKMIITGMMVTLFVAGTLSESAARTIYVNKKPPEKKVVVLKPAKPHANVVWKTGHWEWKRGNYVWVKGSWLEQRPGFSWIDGHWKNTKHGWIWIKGHWKKN